MDRAAILGIQLKGDVDKGCVPLLSVNSCLNSQCTDTTLCLEQQMLLEMTGVSKNQTRNLSFVMPKKQKFANVTPAKSNLISVLKLLTFQFLLEGKEGPGKTLKTCSQTNLLHPTVQSSNPGIKHLVATWSPVQVWS